MEGLLHHHRIFAGERMAIVRHMTTIVTVPQANVKDHAFFTYPKPVN
jgi:hypothetical protein